MTTEKPSKQGSVDTGIGADEWRRKYLWLTLIAGGIVIADQLTKLLILREVGLHASIPVIPGFFHITHVQNPGGAFGFLANQSALVRGILFLAVSTLAVGLVLWFYHQTPPTYRWLANGFALIIGGAVGNLIDRVRFGKVIDFLDFFIRDWHWPAFNVADSAITVGITIFIIHVIGGRIPD
ncbi:MAG: signal peptidase II [Desulfobacterales bacterium]|nr:signal peptidase II [Desulfobacterales bacterium]